MTRRRAFAVATSTFGVLVSGLLSAPEFASAVQGSRLKFEISRDGRSEFRWVLKAANGRVIATSGEGYKAKVDCRNAIAAIKRGASSATVTDLTATS
jgi:uncharacterized protein YegP (UPF0339 family)